MNMKKTMTMFLLITAGWALVPAPGADAQEQNEAAAPRQTGLRQRPAPGQPAPEAVPDSAWYLAIDGDELGPYDMAEMKSMVPTGELTRETLVWKEGMADWAAADTVPGLRTIFSSVPPQPRAPPAREAVYTPEFSTGTRVGMAVLNPILGLGS